MAAPRDPWLAAAPAACRRPSAAAPAGRLPPFDHKTGEGHVPFHGGDYYDARYNTRNQVVPLIVEALDGIGRRGARCLLSGGGEGPQPLLSCLFGGETLQL